jgi:hypothetical protein
MKTWFAVLALSVLAVVSILADETFQADHLPRGGHHLISTVDLARLQPLDEDDLLYRGLHPRRLGARYSQREAKSQLAALFGGLIER